MQGRASGDAACVGGGVGGGEGGGGGGVGGGGGGWGGGGGGGGGRRGRYLGRNVSLHPDQCVFSSVKTDGVSSSEESWLVGTYRLFWNSLHLVCVCDWFRVHTRLGFTTTLN